MLEYLVVVAAFVSLTAAILYIRSMFKGNTIPNRVTWLMWAIAPLIATAAAVYNGVSWAVLPVFMSGFCPLLIFLASFFIHKSYWKLSKIDYICGGLSGLALILWYFTKEPNLAITMSIASDAFAGLPTLKKMWTNPETESVWPFITGVFCPMTSFAAASSWSYSELAFPTYLIVLNFFFVISLYRKKLHLQ
jgi:hypothetical protein